MNRLSLKIVAVTLAMLLLGGVGAQARDKKPKHKKNEDLSANPLGSVKSKQPDKELYDKAMVAMKKGHYDVARLDLQTMLNTYPDSEYRMRAKLSVGDSWFKEGGTAALTQAEAEYKDFITFFPTAPEAAEAQMKVADIYYQQMEKPDRDFTSVERAEQEYRAMILQYPDSPLVPRAKQKLRDVQEVLAEREAQIGLFYESRENYTAAVARLQTVADTYPLYSKSDQVLLGIGDSYAGQARQIGAAVSVPGAVKERLRSVYLDKAADYYSKVITRYPMASHVEDARDRLVAMNRPVPEPTSEATAESDAEERSRQALRFTDRTFNVIKHGPSVVEAVHVGDPSMEDPKRTLAPDVYKQNVALFNDAINAGKPAAASAEAVTPTGVNEPPRTDQPSQAPLQMAAPEGMTGVGVQVVNAPSAPATTTPETPAATPSAPAADANAVIKPVGPTNTTVPAADKPAEAPEQVNEVKSGSTSTATVNAADAKKHKADLSDESSSKKKKKKGISKINPF
jgi:outer membrane protein assembly factor BamD